MKSIVGNEVKVKAAGGIRGLETALKMVDAGAERLGVKIVKDYKKFLQMHK